MTRLQLYYGLLWVERCSLSPKEKWIALELLGRRLGTSGLQELILPAHKQQPCSRDAAENMCRRRDKNAFVFGMMKKFRKRIEVVLHNTEYTLKKKKKERML